MNAQQSELDDTFTDIKGEPLQRYISTTSKKDEHSFYYPERPDELSMTLYIIWVVI